MNLDISPIRDAETQANAGSYHDVPFDTMHPLASEDLVPIDEFGIASEAFYARDDGKNWPYHERIRGALDRVWVRRTVAKKLQEVNAVLELLGVELLVWDGYRPIPCQIGLWEFFHRKVLRERPTWTSERREAAVLNYVSDPRAFDVDNPRTWPVHSTGGAVDLTFRSLVNHELAAMGAQFDSMTSRSHSAFFERQLAQGKIDSADQRLLNRRLLHSAMESQDFVNYPFEFWHFDWGDQMFVANYQRDSSDQPARAWYGYVEPPHD